MAAQARRKSTHRPVGTKSKNERRRRWVNHYAALDQNIKDLEAKKEAIRCRMLQEYEADPSDNVFHGSKHTITLTAAVRTSFDIPLMIEDYGQELFDPYSKRTSYVRCSLTNKKVITS